MRNEPFGVAKFWARSSSHSIVLGLAGIPVAGGKSGAQKDTFFKCPALFKHINSGKDYAIEQL